MELNSDLWRSGIAGFPGIKVRSVRENAGMLVSWLLQNYLKQMDQPPGHVSANYIQYRIALFRVVFSRFHNVVPSLLHAIKSIQQIPTG